MRMPGAWDRLVFLILGFLQLTCGSALAQEVRAVHVPITFHADSGPLRTTACLQVEEHQYPSTRWWEERRPAGTAGAAFKAVVEAMKSGNRSALEKLSDPAQVKNTAEFQKQSDAYIKQMSTYDVAGAARAYAFDGLMVFFAAIQGKSGRSGFAPFVFAASGDAILFLPSRSGLVPTYSLVNDWFNAAWGPGHTATPTYCDPNDLKRATHRVAMSTRDKPSTLFLVGAPIDGTLLASVTARVRAKDTQLRAAAEKGIEALAAQMTAQAAERVKKWAASAPDAERTAYLNAILRQRPFFVFDLSTVLVVYTKATEGVQVLYFTSGDGPSLAWTNATRATSADTIFKRGPLFAAAQTVEPFSALAVSGK